MIPESLYNFPCPYCWQINSLTADISGGLHQEFVVDCETCCAPILIHLDLDNGTIDARRENE